MGAAMRNNRLISVKLWLAASLLAIAVLAGAAPAGVMDPIPGDPVTIDTGKISGTLLASGVHAYLGVPYAAPPINDLRWRAPVALKPWQGIYTADGVRPVCVQRVPASRGFNIAAPVEPLSEDCCRLNRSMQHHLV